MKLCHESIKVFNLQGGKLDFVPFQIIIKRSKHSSYLLNLIIGDLLGLFIVDEVLFIDIRQIDLEIWKIPLNGLIEVLKNEPPGLGMGKIELEDGDWVFGVLGENYICKNRLEITQWGGWRKYKNK